MGLLNAGPARSEDTRSSALGVLFLAPVENDAENDDIIPSINVLLSDLNVHCKSYEIPTLPRGIEAQVSLAARIAADRGAVAVIWYDSRSKKRLSIFAPLANGEYVVARNVEALESDNPSEAIAIIARTTIVEILKIKDEGERSARDISPREDQNADSGPDNRSRETPPTPAVDPAAENHPLLSFNAAYALQFYSSQVLLTHALDLGVEIRPAARWSAWIGFSQTSPIEAREQMAQIEINRRRFYLGTRIHGRLLSKLEWGVRAAVTADYLRYDISNAEQGLTRVEDVDDLLWSMLVGFDVVFPFTQRIGAMVTTAAVIPFNRFYYGIENPTGSEIVFIDPWPVQPRITAGLYMIIL